MIEHKNELIEIIFEKPDINKSVLQLLSEHKEVKTIQASEEEPGKILLTLTRYSEEADQDYYMQAFYPARTISAEINRHELVAMIIDDLITTEKLALDKKAMEEKGIET